MDYKNNQLCIRKRSLISFALLEMDNHNPKGKAKLPKAKLFRFNIMVAGETGQGKTTFLKALLRKYVDDISRVSSILAEKPATTVEISEMASCS